MKDYSILNNWKEQENVIFVLRGGGRYYRARIGFWNLSIKVVYLTNKLNNKPIYIERLYIENKIN